MTKNELIEKLQSIEGNPIVLLSDAELGYMMLKSAELEKMHQSNDDIEKFVTDFDFKSEIGLNTFYQDNYNKNVDECIVLSF